MLKNIGRNTLNIARRTIVDSTVCISCFLARLQYPGPFFGTLLVSNFGPKVAASKGQRPDVFRTLLDHILISGLKFEERTEIWTRKIVQRCFRVCFDES